jgi:SAM-dependent methyltransferase
VAAQNGAIATPPPAQWRRSLTNLLLIPRVAWLSRGAPKNLPDAWNKYWSGVTRTGVGGDVLWDSAELTETSSYRPMIDEYFDPAMPVVDVGCGNGSFTRYLADLFPVTVGVDLSTSAVELARTQSEGRAGLQFRQLDATVPGATADLAVEFGPANVFVRGVFHILTPAARAELARNLLPLVGDKGRVLLVETDYRGGSLGYLTSLGASPTAIPAPLERAIRDIPRPGHFGVKERSLAFPAAAWQVLEDGPTVIQTIPLRAGSALEEIPGYFAVMAARVT